MLIVSYSSPKYKGVYEDYLGKSLKAEGIENCAHLEVPDTGEWTTNTHYKPFLILQAFSQFKADSVLYLDVDATVSKDVNTIDTLVPKHYHSAAHWLDLGAWYGNGIPGRGLLTGTLYFRRTAIPLLMKWLEACKNSKEPDGPILERLMKDDLGVFNLPLDWAYIVSQPSGEPNYVKIEKPIVKHHQISRKLRSGRNYKEVKSHA